MIVPLILFPPLTSPRGLHPDSVWQTVKGGWEGAGRSERLQAGNKNHCLPPLTASRSMCPLFLSLSTLVSRNLSALVTFIFTAILLYRERWSWHEREKRKEGKNLEMELNEWLCGMCLLCIEPAGHRNLYPVSTWCDLARGSLGRP